MSSNETRTMDSASDEEKPSWPGTIRLSAMPANLRESVKFLVKEMDTDGDGVLDEAEIGMAFNALKASRDRNRTLTKAVGGLALFALLLVGAVFGTSIAAARLAKDTAVGGGAVLQDKSTGAVVKTSDAVFWDGDRKLAEMTDGELMGLTHISLLDGGLHFQVKGHARPRAGDGRRVILLVEGGTVTYDEDGIADATGDALSLLNAAFDVDFGGDAACAMLRRFGTKHGSRRW